MSFKDKLTVTKITDAQARERALDVLAVVYQEEKGWVPEREKLLPQKDLESDVISWFAAELDGRTLGVTRVLYEIPVELYQQYGFKLVIPGLDVEKFVRDNKIAEIGRFAVLPEFRRRFHIAAILMRAAATETVEKNFTHYITDVFEKDPNTPYGFHKRVLGFREVATHEVGELKCNSRRITMLLDLKEAFNTMKKKNGYVFRFITKGWNEALIRQLETP